ncbi:hypothetical protein HLB27_21540, partial [Dickeya dadantii]|nr:hypothetical protein [Dickeya dadantii]
DLRLLSSALVNRFGNILAGGSLWIQRDAAGNASDSVLNSSGTIETQRGDITVRTGTLTNQREGLVVTENKTEQTFDIPSWAGRPSLHITLTQFAQCGKGVGARCSGFEYISDDFREINIPLTSSSINVSSSGAGAKLISGGNAYLYSNNLYNQASSIVSNGAVYAEGSVLENKTYQSGNIQKKIKYKLVNTIDEATVGLSSNVHFYYKLEDDVGYESMNGQSYTATIQAGGSITANFSQNISNTSLQPGSGGFMPAMATPTL